MLADQNDESVRIVDLEELKKLEPDLCTDEINSALFSPEEYVVDPFLLPLSNLVNIEDSSTLLILTIHYFLMVIGSFSNLAYD